MPQFAGVAGFHLNGLAERTPQQGNYSRKQVINVDDLRVEHLLAGKGQQSLGQFCPPLGSTHDHVDGAALVTLALAVLHQFRLTQNNGQQVVEIVGHAAC